jgi:hypothetical protein
MHGHVADVTQDVLRGGALAGTVLSMKHIDATVWMPPQMPPHSPRLVSGQTTPRAVQAHNTTTIIIITVLPTPDGLKQVWIATRAALTATLHCV